MAISDFGAGAILALFAGLIVLFVIIMIAVYVYLSLAFMAIGKKAKVSSPGLAWIPAFGPAIIAFKTAKMHWWPWLLLVGYLIPTIGGILVLAFWIFTIVWGWKMFEKVHRPGWWSILMIIPVVNLVLIGVAAWSKN